MRVFNFEVLRHCLGVPLETFGFRDISDQYAQSNKHLNMENK